MPSTLTPDPVTEPFPDHAAKVLRDLRTAISDLFGHVGGIRKSRDVQKLFGLDARLSWQIFKIAGGGDPVALAPHVPSASSMRRLLDSATESGLPGGPLEEVRRAFAAFERLVEVHAGDRASFDSMAQALCENEPAPQADLLHRKAMFKGHSHYFGVQLPTYVVTMFAHPSPGGAGRFDFAHLRSKLGQRRLRSDADVIVDTVNLRKNQQQTAGVDSGYFDPEAAARYDAPVIARLSTQPLPELRTTRTAEGMTWTELTGDAVGRRSAVDLVFGQVWRGLDFDADADGVRPIRFGGQVAITIPTAFLTVDLLVHRASLSRVRAEYECVACENATDVPHPRRRAVRLRFHERIAQTGSGLDGAVLREFPRYPELLEYACEKMQWRISDFDVYRLRVEYPILDTVLNLHATAFDETPPG